jgi:hypothetical protein
MIFYKYLGKFTDGLLPSLLLGIKDFSKLALILRRYSGFLIDSPLLFLA